MTNNEFFLRAVISMAGNRAFTDEDGRLREHIILQEADKLEDAIFDNFPERFENMDEGYSSDVAKLLERISDILDDRL